MPLGAEVENRAQTSMVESDDDDENDGKALVRAGSNFRWRIRMSSAANRRFSLGRRREVVAVRQSTNLPWTIVDFRQYLDCRCPKFIGRGFRLECSVWKPSPYAIIPVPFIRDLTFKSRQEMEESAEASEREREAARYESLLKLCRTFARNHGPTVVEFEVKILFFKE